MSRNIMKMSINTELGYEKHNVCYEIPRITSQISQTVKNIRNMIFVTMCQKSVTKVSQKNV